MLITPSSPIVPIVETSIVSAVVSRILKTRIISRSDQKLLMSLLNRSIISDDDMTLINRIHLGLSNGLLRVVD
ncbi:MAG: hypothetical protein VKJ64_09495 [Leptolyngbyaceae bacterium]|nr:hypothetical protein [Leptolyngbyaceae bacterium]